MLKLLKLAYYQNCSTDSNQIFQWQRPANLFVNGPNRHRTNPRWRTAAISKNRKTADLYDIWLCDAHWPSEGYEQSNVELLKIQYGGRQPSWTCTNGHILATVWPISAKFCTTKHIRPTTVLAAPIPSWNPQNSHISATAWPICVKYGTVIHIYSENRIGS